MTSRTKQLWVNLHFNSMPYGHSNSSKRYVDETEVNDLKDAHVIDSESHGFGDIIVLCWITEGASFNDEKRIVQYAKGDKAQLISLFGHEHTSIQTELLDRNSPYAFSQSEVTSDVPRLRNRANIMGVREPRRPTLVDIPSNVEQWSKKAVVDGTVLLFPQTHHKSREWPRNYWLDLSMLLTRSGIPCRLVCWGKPDTEWFSPSIPFVNLDWLHLAAIMRRASVVVGNDSSPVHLAGTLDIPAIALCGMTRASAFSHYPSVEHLSLSVNELDCVGCYYKKSYRAACSHGCRALLFLAPERVEKVVKKLL